MRSCGSVVRTWLAHGAGEEGRLPIGRTSCEVWAAASSVDRSSGLMPFLPNDATTESRRVCVESIVLPRAPGFGPSGLMTVYPKGMSPLGRPERNRSLLPLLVCFARALLYAFSRFIVSSRTLVHQHPNDDPCHNPTEFVDVGVPRRLARRMRGPVPLLRQNYGVTRLMWRGWGCPVHRTRRYQGVSGVSSPHEPHAMPAAPCPYSRVWVQDCRSAPPRLPACPIGRPPHLAQRADVIQAAGGRQVGDQQSGRGAGGSFNHLGDAALRGGRGRHD